MDSKRLRLDMDSLHEYESSNPTTSLTRPSPTPPGGQFEAGGATPTNGPFRARYNRPLGPSASPSLGNTRYTPYSISRDRPSVRRSVPMIRATRDDDPRTGGGASTSFVDLNTSSGGLGGNPSPTAQKIIDTLSSMSTPVLNSNRVRIDSIKSMKPLALGSAEGGRRILTPMSRFSGPPKTSSPLLLQRSAVSDNLNWTLRNYGIKPKMVDTATNTDESCIANEKKGLALSPYTSPSTQIVALPANNTMNTSNTVNTLNTPSTASFLSNRSPASATALASSGASGSPKPWTIAGLVAMKEAYEQGQLEKSSSEDEDEDDDDEDDDEEGNDNEGATKASPGMVNGDCGKSTSIFSKVKEPEKVKPTATFNFGPSPVKTSLPTKWECSVCMVRNDPAKSKCACCETPNPNVKAEKVTEKVSDKTDSSAGSTATPKNWDCPTCMVPNKPTANVCVCCSEKNPNPVTSSDGGSSPATADPPTASFKFGFANATRRTSFSAPAPASGFAFGAPATTTQSEKTFSFGFQPSSTATSSPAKTTPTTITTNSDSVPSTGLSFGSKPIASAAPFKFGVSNDLDTKFNSAPKKAEPKVIELYECEICTKKVPFKEPSCTACGSPRPREFDPGYVEPEPKPKTEIKFETIFGAPKPAIAPPPAITVSSTPPAPTGATFGTLQPSSLAPVSTAPSSGGFGSTSAFGSGTTFSSGNPFGGGGAAFGASSNASSNNMFGAGSDSNATPTATSAPPPGLFSGGAASTSTFSAQGQGQPGASSMAPSQGFTFGSGSPTKRKLDDGSSGFGGDPAKKIATSSVPTFTFGGAASTPQLKLKEVPTPLFAVNPTPAAAPAPTNNAGFLEALKNASAAVKASSEKQSNTVTSTSGPPPIKSFAFGSNEPIVPPSGGGGFFNNPNAGGFGNNAFGSSANAGIFSAPSMGSNPPPAIAPVAPAPQFNMTPSFNFGAQAPPPSTFNFGAAPSMGAGGNGAAPFQFSATPSGSPAIAERKIKRATRRFPR